MLGGDIKVAYPGKTEIGHKWTTWYVEWKNYTISVVWVSVIPLDFVTRRDIPEGWNVANDHDRLKHQVIQIGLAW